MANVDTSQPNDKIRRALEELYGNEEMLIVRNNTNGVVSIGFGNLGDEGGMPGGIPRSKMPQVLTDHFPRTMWLAASDFRRAVSKGWISLISKEDYEKELSQHRQRRAELLRMAAEDEPVKSSSQAIGPNPFSDDPDGEPQVIDEETSQLTPASKDGSVRRFMEYEGMEAAEGPRANTPPGVTVMGGQVSSRAVSFCEQQRRGDLTNIDAINWLDQEDKLLSVDDLNFITGNSTFASVKNQARRILADRTATE